MKNGDGGEISEPKAGYWDNHPTVLMFLPIRTDSYQNGATGISNAVIARTGLEGLLSDDAPAPAVPEPTAMMPTMRPTALPAAKTTPTTTTTATRAPIRTHELYRIASASHNLSHVFLVPTWRRIRLFCANLGLEQQCTAMPTRLMAHSLDVAILMLHSGYAADCRWGRLWGAG